MPNYPVHPNPPPPFDYNVALQLIHVGRAARGTVVAVMCVRTVAAMTATSGWRGAYRERFDDQMGSVGARTEAVSSALTGLIAAVEEQIEQARARDRAYAQAVEQFRYDAAMYERERQLEAEAELERARRTADTSEAGDRS
jgi:uncharacterized protein YukE